MAYMDCPPIWSFLFFFMLVNLAISSGCGGVQTLGTFFMDEWPSLRNRRMLVFIGIASVLFLAGNYMKNIILSISCLLLMILEANIYDKVSK